MESIDDTNQAIEDLRDGLMLNIDLQVSTELEVYVMFGVPMPSQPPMADEKSFKVLFKAVKFELLQRMFNDSVERIKYNDSTVAALTSQNIELELLRLHQRCLVSNHLKFVQHHARSLYGVIEKSWQGQCSTTHSAELCLDARLVGRHCFTDA